MKEEVVMDPAEVFEEFRSKIRGQLVTDRQLAGNSLSVWIATGADERVGYTVWFEPSWHVAGLQGVVAGSRQAQDQDEPSGWQAVSGAIQVLLGHEVEDLRRDPATGDLELVISNAHTVRSFVTDPRDDFLWCIRELATGRRLNGSPNGATKSESA
jgi:hypothetical protein